MCCEGSKEAESVDVAAGSGGEYRGDAGGDQRAGSRGAWQVGSGDTGTVSQGSAQGSAGVPHEEWAPYATSSTQPRPQTGQGSYTIHTLYFVCDVSVFIYRSLGAIKTLKSE